MLDPDAVRALQRLRTKGFEAYLVGGCVRDLLVGLKPKDFDIATSAPPQQMRKVFPRNCRVIGRRFKLAHLHFNGNTKILEAATFRRTPEGVDEDSEDDDLLIIQDNLFGTAEQDAVRRDFTVNALFFDPLDDRIIDYTGGLADVRARVIRTIGDPETRFREDPVRILRAAKFAGRLGFTIDQPTYAAMKAVAPDLTRSAPPRLLEEILRLLRGGHSLESFQILRDVEALQVILPVVGDYLRDAAAEERVLFWRTLESLDNRVARGDVPQSPVLLGALFNRPLQALAEQSGRSPTTVAEEVIGPFALDLRLPRRDAGGLKRICGVQTRFTTTGRRRFRLSSFLRDGYFPQALELFELTCRASGEGFDQLERWRQLHAEASSEGRSEPRSESRSESQEEGQAAEAAAGGSSGEASRPGGDRPRRRRRRRRRASGHPPKEPPQAPVREPVEETTGRSKDDRQPRNRKQKRRRRKSAADKTESTKTESRRPEARRPESDKKRKRKRRRKERDAVQMVEPELVDVSAFDMELDPSRVPTFTTFVEGEEGARKQRRRPRLPREEADTYKPPPPPGTDSGDSPPPPPADDDVFGDW